MSTIVGLQLDPLDVLFFRDGRPFGAATRGQSDLPLPQTLAGAIWTGLLAQHGGEVGAFAAGRQQGDDFAAALRRAHGPEWLAEIRVRGPWLARPAAAAAPGEPPFEVLVPAPAVLHAVKGNGGDRTAPLPRLRPLRPDQLPGWRQTVTPEQADLWPLWLREREQTEPVAGYLTPHGLRQFLADQAVCPADVVAREELFAFDHRTGIGIEPDRLSAQTGLIYEASFLALKRDPVHGQHVFLYAEVALPAGPDPTALAGLSPLAFGGEGRRVRVTPVEPFPWHLYECPPSGNGRPLLLLITPGLFAGRWRPESLPGPLLAAAVPGAVPVSGWDLARAGPKPARFAAPAGSVYFLDRPPQAHPNHPPVSLADRPVEQAQGWGCYLKGVWTDA